jgi:hypothetical protein
LNPLELDSISRNHHDKAASKSFENVSARRNLNSSTKNKSKNTLGDKTSLNRQLNIRLPEIKKFEQSILSATKKVHQVINLSPSTLQRSGTFQFYSPSSDTFHDTSMAD